MTEIIQSIILGVVQGITEFLPISSSGHLNLFPWLLNWNEISESFDVALHLGTLLAICVFFFYEWVDLFKCGFIVAKEKLSEKRITKKQATSDIQKTGKMFWYLVLASIPAAALTLILDKLADLIIQGNIYKEMSLIGIALVVMGIILYLVDKKSKSDISYDKITLKQAVIIGTSQALAAAFPGVSRSGITMTVARALKIDRESAAKFSFLLATPIVTGAVLVNITNFSFSTSFFVGILASFISGLIVIKFLMDYLKKGSFKGFAIYRAVLGIFVLCITLGIINF